MNRRLLIIIGIVLGVLLLILVAAALLGGSGGKKKEQSSSDGPTTLTVWRVDDNKSTMDPIIQDFQGENGNIKVEYKQLERGNYEQQLVEALAAGKGPDVFQVHNTWMPRYYDKIAPIPEDMYKTEDYEREFFPAIVSDTVVNRRIYGIPFYLDTLALYYNTELFGNAFLAEAPKTWNDLVGKDKPADQSYLKLNSRQGNTFNQSAIALGNNRIPAAPDVVALLMLQLKTTMVNEAKDKALFNLPQQVEGKDRYLGREATDFFIGFAQPTTPVYSWNDSQGDAVTAFSKNKLAMFIGYPYHRQVLERLNPELRYEIAPVPQIGGSDPINYASYWPEVVSKTSQNQEAAWKFIRFVTDKDHLPVYLSTTKRVSPRTDVDALGELEVFYAQNPSAVTWYKGDAARTNQIFTEMISRLLRGEDIARALDAAAEQETSVLQDVKQRFGRPQ